MQRSYVGSITFHFLTGNSYDVSRCFGFRFAGSRFLDMLLCIFINKCTRPKKSPSNEADQRLLDLMRDWPAVRGPFGGNLGDRSTQIQSPQCKLRKLAMPERAATPIFQYAHFPCMEHFLFVESDVCE